eukprot:m.91153 g.91153  ORF g.91153 m.91153 type:complete len:675 (+) comp14618_c0_seq1:119-2143(+)
MTSIAETADAVAEILTALAAPDGGKVSSEFQWWSDLVDGSDNDGDDEDADEDDHGEDEGGDFFSAFQTPEQQPEAEAATDFDDVYKMLNDLESAFSIPSTDSKSASNHSHTCDTTSNHTSVAASNTNPFIVATEEPPSSEPEQPQTQPVRGILKTAATSSDVTEPPPVKPDTHVTGGIPSSGSNFSRWRKRVLSVRAKNFQASLRHSIRKRSTRAKQAAKNEDPENYIEGIADVLSVLAEHGQSTQLSAPVPQTPEADKEEEGQHQSPFSRHMRESMRRRDLADIPRGSSRRNNKSPVMRQRAMATQTSQRSKPRPQSASSTVPSNDTANEPMQRTRSTVVMTSRPIVRVQEVEESVAPALEHASPVVSAPSSSQHLGLGRGRFDEAVTLKRAFPGLSRSRLGASVRRGHISEKSAKLSAQFVAGELQKLVNIIKSIGRKEPLTGLYSITFGVLYDRTDGLFEGADVDNVLVTARSMGIVSYLGGLLFAGRDDFVTITLESEDVPTDENAYTLGQIRNVSIRRSRRKSTSNTEIPLEEQRLGASVRKGHLSAASAAAAVKWVDKQMRLLVEAIVKYGRPGDDGKIRINYGVLYDKTVNTLEAAEVGALLDSARSRGIVSYVGEELKEFEDDFTTITLLTDEVTEATEDSYTFKDIRRMSLRQRKSARRSQRTPR